MCVGGCGGRWRSPHGHGDSCCPRQPQLRPHHLEVHADKVHGRDHSQRPPKLVQDQHLGLVHRLRRVRHGGQVAEGRNRRHIFLSLLKLGWKRSAPKQTHAQRTATGWGGVRGGGRAWWCGSGAATDKNGDPPAMMMQHMATSCRRLRCTTTFCRMRSRYAICGRGGGWGSESGGGP
jgi:hypothetical protein